MPKRSWTQQEDQALIKIIQTSKNLSWEQIANILSKQFDFRLRSAKQCNQRWKNVLKPDLIKNKWSQEEEVQLFKLHDLVGNKWCKIMKKLKGRSYNDIKNHFYSHIRKGIRTINNQIKKINEGVEPLKYCEINFILGYLEKQSKKRYFDKFKQFIIQNCIEIKSQIIKISKIQDFTVKDDQRYLKIFSQIRQFRKCIQKQQMIVKMIKPQEGYQSGMKEQGYVIGEIKMQGQTNEVKQEQEDGLFEESNEMLQRERLEQIMNKEEGTLINYGGIGQDKIRYIHSQKSLSISSK